jgi:hypothetical protein
VKIRVAVAVTLGLIALMALWKLHFIKDEGGQGEILWKSNEAYLFMSDAPIGYRLSVFGYLWEPLKEYFHASARPSDDKLTITVLRITPAGVQRRDQQSTLGFWDISPVRGEIYSHCPGGMCKWTGTEFRLISDQEEQRIDRENPLSKEDFSNIDSWSRRGVRSSWAGEHPQFYKFSIGLGDWAELVVSGHNPVSIDLLKPGHPSERVWYHEQRTRMVSAAEYNRTFRGH